MQVTELPAASPVRLDEVQVIDDRPRRQRKAIGVLLILLAAACAGFGVYAVLFTQVLVPLGLVPIEVERTVRRAELLRDLARQDARSVLVFGSSVVLEGVDAAAVEETLPGRLAVYNIAESNAGLRNLMMNMPLILEARPRVLVCCLRRSQLAAGSWPELPSELLIGYAYAGYVDTAQRRPAWIYERLTESERDALPGYAVTKLLASRVFVLRSIEEKLRHAARPDLRSEGFESNFRAPWRYTRRIPPDRLEMLVQRSRATYPDLRYDSRSPIADVLHACVERSAAAGVAFLLVITPEHPQVQAALPTDVRERFDAAVAVDCAAHGGRTFVMDAHRFTQEDFLDHSHVSASGRAVFSRALGEALAGSVGD